MATKKKKASTSRAAAKKKPAAAAKKKPAAAAKKKPAAAAKKAVASKPAVRRVPAAKRRAASVSTPTPTPLRRRDGAGHLDAKYAETLREKSREGRVRDRDDAFIGRAGRSKDNLAEAMGETWVQSATSGEDEGEDVFNQSVPEDDGGPFVTTTAGQEFAEGTDASNPEQSKREPFPKT